MCGIYGILDLNGGQPDVERLRAMAAVTVHRGPDDGGEYIDAGLAMGMRRLSIIDVAGGHQPLFNEDQSLSLVCNGEIYNFRSLRTDLQSKGHKFHTNSDSEVVLHLYEEYGDRCIEHLDGMFGFALWDSLRRRLLIGRDRLGIKPIYLMQTDQELIFGSELKALLAIREGKPTVCNDALEDYLLWGYVPQPLTLFSDMEKLPQACLLIADADSGQVSSRTYWRPENIAAESLNAQQWVDRVRAQIEQSVASQMVSDVPIGAFLSGGIDSSAIVAMMSKHTDEPIRTYSIGFEADKAGSTYDETGYARQVAERFGTRHQEIIVNPDVVGLLPQLLWHLDEPIADSAFVTTFLVSEFASRDVKVILSGVGGDELFGGYRRYLGSYYGRWLKLIPPAVRRGLLAPLMGRLPSDRHSTLLNYVRYARSLILAHDKSEVDQYREYVGVFSDEAMAALLPGKSPSRDVLREAMARFQDTGPNGLMGADLVTQLPDDLLMLTDKMTMASSIECRVPLLDQALVELSLAMPAEQKIAGRELKHVLKRAMKDILPKEILYRPKRGFGAPMGAWLKSSLSQVTRDLLDPRTVANRGLFNPSFVTQLIEQHEKQREDFSDHLQSLVNLEIFLRIYQDGRAPADVSDELKSLSAHAAAA